MESNRSGACTVDYSVVICTLDRTDDLKRCIASWLQQNPQPRQIVVVHGGRDETLGESLPTLFADAAVELTYVRMLPSLVRQRNAGILHAIGDVVFFADDDAVYLDGYAKHILEVYDEDRDRAIGGVQGTIEGFNGTVTSRVGLARLFLLTRMGDGTLQRSAWPAFYRGTDCCARVRVFSGVAMSFRREVLQEFQFDDALAHYWVGDDFDMAYRVSAKFKLFQARDARLIHYLSPLGRDGARRLATMHVVNHFYLSRKFFGTSWVSRLCLAWAQLGLWIVAALWLLTGRGAGRLRGMAEGYRELWVMARSRQTARTGE